MERDRSGKWTARHLVASARADSNQGDDEWHGVSFGITLAGEHAVYIAEGNSGRVVYFDWNTDRRRTFDLNQAGYSDSYTGDLAFDAQRAVLYVADQANFRVCAIDTRSRRVLASIKVGRLPFALALSPDRQKLYVTNAGRFQYNAFTGTAGERSADALSVFPPSWPAPSTANDPAAREGNSLAVIDVSDPAAAKVETFLPTGTSPSGVLAAQDRVYVSNAGSDSISVIDARTNRLEAEIPLRVPGFENLRGVIPGGMAFDPATGWLLVAEAGLNAVGIVDVREKRLIGHLPAGWFPTRVALAEKTVIAANSRGQGAGQNAALRVPGHVRDGSVSIFPLPAATELGALTSGVLESAGLTPAAGNPRALPEGIRHVVLIVKSSRSYDEVLGDVRRASNGPVAGQPLLARFGRRGYVDGRGRRFSLQEVNVTPNHHALAERWAWSDNFYADSETAMGGHRWLAGVYPNLWTATSLAAAASDQRKEFRLGSAPGRLIFPGTRTSATPEDQSDGGTLWEHLARHGVSFYNFGEGLDLPGSMQSEDGGVRYTADTPLGDALHKNTSRTFPGPDLGISDQQRATRFIAEIESRYGKPGTELPRFLFVCLPGDRTAEEKPAAGYLYRESFLVDNDYALGRIVEYLSSTPWWKQMVVFITEDSAEGGVDHIDASRTLLLAAGPWVKRNYVSHVNASFPALLKTVFGLLRIPALNLFDASAADLRDWFRRSPEDGGYPAQPVDKRIFDPGFTPPAGTGGASRGVTESTEKGQPRR